MKEIMKNSNNKQNAFDQKKKHILQQITDTTDDSPDKSPKGYIDAPLLPLIELINAHPDLVTTSSCSGRVSVYLEGEKSHSRPGSKGLGGRWLFITHEVKELANWWPSVKDQSIECNNDTESNDNDPINKRYVLYKFEPMILHVKCRDLATAQKLYKVAMDCGYRESGIGSNNLVGIRTSMGLDVPIAQVCSEQSKLDQLVQDEYIALLDCLATDLFRKNQDKITQLSTRFAAEFQ